MSQKTAFATIVLLLLVLFMAGNVVSADDEIWRERESIFYSKAVPNAANFHARLVREETPWPDLGVRSLMDHAYVLAFAAKFLVDNPDENPGWKERLDLEQTVRMLEIVEEMQDKDEKSATFGNLRWYWRTKEVTDLNAVEFISAHAIPVRHEAFDLLPAESQELLERILRRSLEGCLKRTVRPDYTNIALGNAVHLILLGELYDRPDAVKTGHERLREVMFAIWDHGIFEYNSPTYYAINADALNLGYRYIKNEEAKNICKTLLDYLWTDIALNWFGPAQRLTGTHSRSYNYLHSQGDTSRLLEFAGLSPFHTAASHSSRLESFIGKYRPENATLELTNVYPRELKQRWGARQGRWRTSYFLEDITLGTSAAPYPNSLQDIVLAVDLADYPEFPDDNYRDSLLPRCYFIPDGRNDPHGTVRYSTSNAGHNKALHLEPFWTAAQRTTDAVGIVLYTDVSLRNPNAETVVSHFVFRHPDEIRVGGKKFTNEDFVAEISHEIRQGEPVIIRYGTRAIGMRIPWTRTEKGNRAKIILHNDRNEHGVARISVQQWENSFPLPLTAANKLANLPGAVFQVRIGNSLDEERVYERWCDEFIATKPELTKITRNDFTLEMTGNDGPVKVSGTNILTKNERLNFTPGPPSAIFEFNGKELGRSILETAEPLKSYINRMKAEIPLALNSKGETEWEAESGISFHESLIETRPNAAKNKAVRINGPIHWTFKTQTKGTYYLWARVLCLDPEHDSVYADFTRLENGIPADRPGSLSGIEWSLGHSKSWRWVPLKFDRPENPTAIDLPPGAWRLRLTPREKDAIIDRFLITTNPNKKFNPK